MRSTGHQRCRGERNGSGRGCSSGGLHGEFETQRKRRGRACAVCALQTCAADGTCTRHAGVPCSFSPPRCSCGIEVPERRILRDMPCRSDAGVSFGHRTDLTSRLVQHNANALGVHVSIAASHPHAAERGHYPSRLRFCSRRKGAGISSGTGAPSASRPRTCSIGPGRTRRVSRASESYLSVTAQLLTG